MLQVVENTHALRSGQGGDQRWEGHESSKLWETKRKHFRVVELKQNDALHNGPTGKQHMLYG